MKVQIIDSSVAIKWFVDEEQGKSEALEILEAIKKSPRYFAVPELFFNEMLAVFVRLIDAPESVKEYMNILQDLGLERIGNGRTLLETAAQISIQYQITGYDAIYAACAKLMNGKWLTFDRDAAKRIKTLELAEVL